jgi:hypothetical protein
LNTPNLDLSVNIAGDVTIDWHILNQNQDNSDGAGWNPNIWTRACGQPGGAMLLANLVEAISEKLIPYQRKITFQKPFIPSYFQPKDRTFHHSYAIWSQFNAPKGRAWRVEQFLGLDQRSGRPQTETIEVVDGNSPNEDIVILDDANLGFRDDPANWPQAIMEENKPIWILVKMSKPVAQGALWDHLLKNHADRLILVIPVNDLRFTEVHISKGLSWERTAQDLAWELVHNPCINSLSHCPYVVISFGTAGAILLEHPNNDNLQGIPEFQLFFDPQVIEGMWGHDYLGNMIGYTTCLTASIAHQLMLSVDLPNIHQGIQSGLSAMQNLFLDGYDFDGTKDCELAFPTGRILESLTKENQSFAKVKVENPVYDYEKSMDLIEGSVPRGWWTILEDRYQDNLAQVAERVVKRGIESALNDVPQGCFGHLLTVDRQEIESFRSVHSLVSEYLSKEQQKRPLSIAVFGAPGSGKSFGITQVSKSLAPGRMQVLEFNMSQFGETDEIIDALHRVRDVALSGMIPLVFWDEFDSSFEGNPLGWLRYFLAPMQDGAFREGQIVHPIGRAIFVFAGGTSHTMAGFGSNLTSEDARTAKVPDFISRLKGYVNILGPNPPEGEGDVSASDPYYIIRRAILVRSLLERNAPQLFEKKEGEKKLNIDSGVLRGFLNISHYKHGIRSIESIIDMSQLSGKRSFERSSLPPEDQLGLAVDSKEFTSLVQQIKLEGDLLEKMAQAYHRFYQKQMLKERAEKANGREIRQTSADLSWEELTEEEKEQNRSAVRDIPEKLAKIGFIMLPSRSDQPIFTFPENDKDLEKLSKMEHDRWAALKEKAGWKYAAETNKEAKHHQSLRPWEQLSESDKEKDRALVRAIPIILAEVGYTMLQLRKGG